ncbi:sigma-70 family RNA polymerase sigma factor [Hoyosella sp. YIM 151337]|uniref:sigma-70 family RNA polymerase sigma factor n=1 Tax=Hoyosella sp. YIM 151337 TaxID=2992742 RepID=UPI002236ABFB|nr:sigma-70 family RNA polymerase sigma factor [Hoyosella sp. YIM 151337]MCW4354248.1 sigma-70 family RNA polymerase sigma factor [Hoyosella sp. YIM 151337]
MLTKRKADAVPEHQSKDAFQQLARAQLPRLVSLARALTRDDAEDLVQDALLRGFQAFGELREPEAAGKWLRVILINTFRDRLRRQSHMNEIPVADPDDFSLFRTITDEDPFPYSDSLHLDFLCAFGKEDVRQVLLRLPERYRVPLILCHMEGFATKEIAKMFNAPLGTVLARLHRGRKAFEREMWSYAEENGLLKEGGRNE